MRNNLKILSCLLTVLVAIGFDFTSKQKARAEAVVCGDLYVDEHCNDIDCINANNLYQNNDTWNMDIIDAERAWDINSFGEEVLVGVCDTGINPNHESLKGRVDMNLSRTFWNGNVSKGGNDDNGHGTHVAGTILGKKPDQTEIGIAAHSNVKLVSLKVCDYKGEVRTEDLINAIEYAEENDIRILNMSLTFSFFDQDLKNAIQKYSGLVVAASGNIVEISSSYYPLYPASFGLENIISVGASDIVDERALFRYCYYHDNRAHASNDADDIDIYAPGKNIYSAGLDSYSYEFKSGTSMATPLISGAAAMIASVRPDFDARCLKETLINTADVIWISVRDRSNSTPYKTADALRLNIGKAVYNSLFVSEGNTIKEIKQNQLSDLEIPAYLYNALSNENCKIEALGDSLFEGFGKLEKVILSESITNIGSKVFFDCDNLSKIYVKNASTEIIELQMDSFDGLKKDYEIFISEAVYDLYALDECWNKIINHIVESKIADGIFYRKNGNSEKWIVDVSEYLTINTLYFDSFQEIGWMTDSCGIVGYYYSVPYFTSCEFSTFLNEDTYQVDFEIQNDQLVGFECLLYKSDFSLIGKCKSENGTLTISLPLSLKDQSADFYLVPIDEHHEPLTFTADQVSVCIYDSKWMEA